MWGHQLLFYKFSGGSYRNLKDSVNADLNPGTDAPTRKYPFWSKGLRETAGKHTVTIKSYKALTQNHFSGCVPWRGRTLPFWSDRFLNWNKNDANGPGTTGKDFEARPYFDGRPSSLWLLCGLRGAG